MFQRVLTLHRRIRRIQHNEDRTNPTYREEQFNVSFTVSREDTYPILRLDAHRDQTTRDLLAPFIQLPEFISGVRPWNHDGVSVWEFSGLFFE